MALQARFGPNLGSEVGAEAGFSTRIEDSPSGGERVVPSRMTDEIAAQIVTGAFTLAAAGIGWWLTLTTDWMARRRARREALGAILAALLEVRHRVVTLRAVATVLDGFPAEHRSTWLRAIEGVEDMLPDLDALSDAYEEAVALLSRESPVLAFQLRFKDRAFGQVSDVRALFEQLGEGEPPDALVHAVSRLMGSLTTESLDTTILRVAWGHGVATRWRVASCLKTEGEQQVEVQAFFARYIDELVRLFPAEEFEIRKVFADIVAPKAMGATRL